MGLGIQLTDPAEAVGPAAPPGLVERYQNAYRVAKAACGLASAAKVIGFIVGAALLAAGVQGRSVFGGAAIGLGVLVAALFWILGTLVAAIGENLKAVLDTAIYSSTFLNNAQRAKIMSLE